MRIVSTGHALFAGAMIILGLMGLISGDFGPIWDSVPKAWPARAVLAYLCNLVCLACGIGLFLRRTAAMAARVLFIYLLLWLLVIKGRYIVLAPLVEGPYQSAGETAVFVAAAWVLYAWFAGDWDRRHVEFAVGAKGLRIARVLYGLALIAFGLSHFAYLELTAPLVPNWLPGHTFWAYFTGATYLAAGTAIIIGAFARPAAVLSALQIGLMTVLVWVPILMAGHLSKQHWIETVVSCALTAGAWVVAESYQSAERVPRDVT
jgi:uncharacterized membrane protein